MKELHVSEERMQEIKEEEEKYLTSITDDKLLEEQYFRCRIRKTALEYMLKKGVPYDDFDAMAVILLVEKAYNSGIQVTPFDESVYGKYTMSILTAVADEFANLPEEARQGLSFGSGAGLATYYSCMITEYIEKSHTLLQIKKDAAAGMSNEQIMERNNVPDVDTLLEFLKTDDTPELKECIDRLNETAKHMQINRKEQ